MVVVAVLDGQDALQRLLARGDPLQVIRWLLSAPPVELLSA
jgi:hypothetical protein